MRGFPDLPSREVLKARFYEGELWKSELENLLMPMIDKYKVVLLDDPTDCIHWLTLWAHAPVVAAASGGCYFGPGADCTEMASASV
jgi:hypothetical protein